MRLDSVQYIYLNDLVVACISFVIHNLGTDPEIRYENSNRVLRTQNNDLRIRTSLEILRIRKSEIVRAKARELQLVATC